MLIRLCQKFGEYNKVTSLIDCITCRPVPHSNCTADLIVLFFYIKSSAKGRISDQDLGFVDLVRIRSCNRGKNGIL